MPKTLNRVSSRITAPKSQGASQAMLYGIGLSDADMHKPQVGIGSVWYEGNPCNMHLNDLAARVKAVVEAAGAVGLRFNTIGVSDGISMGTEGMSYSLPSRDLIADSIEAVMRAQWYDANISLPGCDKNMPGCLIAMARAVDLPLALDDFQRVSDRIPLLADMKPSGTHVQEDLDRVGGLPALMKYLLQAGLLNGDCLTVTGKTLAENLEAVGGFTQGQRVVRPLEDPLHPRGHIQILRGNLAPEGAVAKITGKEGTIFKGRANVFDSEEAMLTALTAGKIFKGDVVVIRCEGPKGGPGMPEMLTPTSAIMGAGLGREVALITDGRFSGGSHGFIVGHISPEAQESGPIALVQTGDPITIDAAANTIEVHLDDTEMATRRRSWTPPPCKVSHGVLKKYIKTVRPASEGCVTDE
jgi:dihydroxyacid dehydratase/phosphogluconate dehydratase